MIGRLSDAADVREASRAAMVDALEQFGRTGPIVILSHFDADGLASAAILTRALEAGGYIAAPLVLGKAETPWDPEIGSRIAAHQPAGLVLADLGTRATAVLPGCPTLVIDHHVPTGEPPDAITISGNGLTPEPTTALLAWWAAAALGDQSDLLWLAAIGLIGDMAQDRGFPELGQAEARWGKTALREATSLINAPRRTASADAAPALRLLLGGSGPKSITKGEDADAQALREAKAEVRSAMEVARRVAPTIAGDVALLALNSPCQIHPLVAQQWRGRLRNKIVIAANAGYRPGWVHFAARSASGRNLIDFLASHRPAGADSRYGNGHAQATGGALKAADWNDFITELGLPGARISL